jgi:hypothetical protein
MEGKKLKKSIMTFANNFTCYLFYVIVERLPPPPPPKKEVEITSTANLEGHQQYIDVAGCFFFIGIN